MPPKRSRYEVDEYIPTANMPTATANNSTGGSQPITQRHTQYEMSDALRSSRVKTVLNVEHDAEPTTFADAMVADDTNIPDLIQVDYDSEDEETDNLEGNSGYDDDIDRELEAAGLGEIRVPQARRVRKIHTVSQSLSHPLLVFFTSHVRTTH
jgi:hypothetical protein